MKHIFCWWSHIRGFAIYFLNLFFLFFIDPVGLKDAELQNVAIIEDAFSEEGHDTGSDDDLLIIDKKDVNSGAGMVASSKNDDTSDNVMKNIKKEGQSVDNDDTTDDTSMLEDRSKNLLKMAFEHKNALQVEYLKVKKNTLRELEKSRNHVQTLKSMLELTKDEDKKRELEEMISKLEENSEKFEKHILYVFSILFVVVGIVQSLISVVVERPFPVNVSMKLQFWVKRVGNS